MFGEKKFFKIVEKYCDRTDQELMTEIVKAINSFTRGAEQSDDITLMILSRKQ